MVTLTCLRSTSRDIWHSMEIECRSRNSYPTSSTITSRTHSAKGFIKVVPTYLVVRDHRNFLDTALIFQERKQIKRKLTMTKSRFL